MFSSLSVFDVFHAFVLLHILTGSIGLVAFWIPVASKKGSRWHRQAGRIFTVTMLITGATAIGISVCTLIDPVATHPQLKNHVAFSDPALISAIFGWMMLGLAIMTINLTWYGWLCVTYKSDRLQQRDWRNLGLQVATFIAATNCAYQGYLVNQPLMLGMSFIGWATVATNLYFLYKPTVSRLDWLKEHIKGLVGTGISVYTAFFAFGAVRTFPALALHPVLWAIPLTVGLVLIVYFQLKISRGRQILPKSTQADMA